MEGSRALGPGRWSFIFPILFCYLFAHAIYFGRGFYLKGIFLLYSVQVIKYTHIETNRTFRSKISLQNFYAITDIIVRNKEVMDNEEQSDDNLSLSLQWAFVFFSLFYWCMTWQIGLVWQMATKAKLQASLHMGWTMKFSFLWKPIALLTYKCHF